MKIVLLFYFQDKKLNENCDRILSVPIFSSENKVIGVAQLINKNKEEQFTEVDITTLEVISFNCFFIVFSVFFVVFPVKSLFCLLSHCFPCQVIVFSVKSLFYLLFYLMLFYSIFIIKFICFYSNDRLFQYFVVWEFITLRCMKKQLN